MVLWAQPSPQGSTQTASRSVQPFLQGSLVRQTDRPRYTRSVTIGRTYVRSTAMRPNNNSTHVTNNNSEMEHNRLYGQWRRSFILAPNRLSVICGHFIEDL